MNTTKVIFLVLGVSITIFIAIYFLKRDIGVTPLETSTALEFSGTNSYHLDMPPVDKKKQFYIAEFDIQTETTDNVNVLTTPLTAEQNWHFILSLKNGMMVLTADVFNRNNPDILRSTVVVNDGEWHNVKVVIINSSVNLVVDEIKADDMAPIIGGLWPLEYVFGGRGFVGSIKDVMIDSMAFDDFEENAI